MTKRIRVTTRFDITATGTRNRLGQHQLPFTDAAGRKIKNLADWQFSRNQQINWETMNQLISLRTLPENVEIPVYDKQSDSWSFVFTIPDISTVGTDSEPFKYLLRDCEGVPMISNLTESIQDFYLKTDSNTANIWFRCLTDT